MNDFISTVTSQLGIGETEGRSATGGILNLLKGQLDESTFSSILEKIPGAADMMNSAEAGGESKGGGGLMGSLTSMAGSLLGGGDGGPAGVAKVLADSGIGLDKAGGFVTALVTFLKDKLGDDTFAAIAKQLPGLFGSDE